MEALRLQPRLNRLALLLQLQSLKHVYAFIKDNPLHFSCHFVGRPFFLLLFTLHCTYIPKLYHILYIFYPWNIQIHRHRNLQMAPGRIQGPLTRGLNQREILSRTIPSIWQLWSRHSCQTTNVGRGPRRQILPQGWS